MAVLRRGIGIPPGSDDQRTTTASSPSSPLSRSTPPRIARPRVVTQPAAPDRWAEDRQYLRNDIADALATFRCLREGTLGHLTALSPEQWLAASTRAAAA